jgi:hypothetical protein
VGGPVARRVATWICALACASLACRTPQWAVAPKLRAPDEDVAAALGATSHENAALIEGADVPEIAYPRKLRPCCAFGTDLKVEVGVVPVPGVELGNLVDPAEIGPHRYDNGFLSLQRGDPRGAVDLEHNGLVYTCRGGFIDLAHVRDNADNTLSLATSLARTLETGSLIELPPQGAAIRVRVRPISAAAVARYGRRTLSVALAQWLAFQASIWHEIATYYGYASLASWPEKVSAFSPEDLYSNALGTRIAAGVILSKGARSNVEYGLTMDAWIARTLERLDAVPLADSEAAMQSVDGRWWDSGKRIPDWTLVARRSFDFGPLLHPWRVEDAGVATPAACLDTAPPLVLRVHDGFSGVPFRDHASVEFEIGDALVAAGFPLPRPGSRLVTQDDFEAIVAHIRSETEQALGAGAGAP